MNDRPSERELIRRALGPGPDCPPAEALGSLLENPQAQWAGHVAGCSFCQTELQLLRSFESGEINPADAAAVKLVTQRLRERSAEIFPRKESWWRGLLSMPKLAPAALAFAALLIVAGLSLQFRHGAPPDLRAPGDDVMRSQAVTVLAPVGDSETKPSEVEWQAVAAAAKYEVRLLEVDRTELWKTDTVDNRVALPAAVQARIAPAKTLMVQVRALDAAGRTLAESDLVRFRLLQKIYSR